MSGAAEPTRRAAWRSDTALLAYVSIAIVAVHLAGGGRFGFHRDELATLDDARHLAWGYVAYPPLTPFFGRISLALFGTSVEGFRFFSVLAQAAAVFFTGLMARELGGRRGAQIFAATAAVPIALVAGALMEYVSFDYLAWVLTAYFTVRMLQWREPRWWIAIGGAIGIGMMTRYSIPFLIAGLGAGLLFSDARKLLATKWIWYGAAVALLIFLPNLIWQVKHDFVTLDFLRNIHARDIRIGRAEGFFTDQIKLTLLRLPLWIAGLWFYLFSEAGKRFRALAWMYFVPLALLALAKGRGYYLVAAYPMLYAAGSVWGEQWVQSLRRHVTGGLRAIAWTALAVDIAVAFAVALPLSGPDSAWWKFASKANGDLREEVGWPELVETIAHIRDSLPASERTRTGILAGNYGEAGAINLYGPRYGLPSAISGINSFWQRGYGDPPPDIVIALGFSRQFLERNFATCELAGHASNRYGVENEETSDYPGIFVCRGLRQSWPEFWKTFRHYG